MSRLTPKFQNQKYPRGAKDKEMYHNFVKLLHLYMDLLELQILWKWCNDGMFCFNNLIVSTKVLFQKHFITTAGEHS